MSSGAHRKLRRHLAAGLWRPWWGSQPANGAEAAKPAPACHGGAQAGGHRPASPRRRAESSQCPREQDWLPGVHSGRACCTRDRCCSSLLPQHGEGGRESQGTLRWLLPCAPDQSPRFGGPGPEHVHLTPGHRPGTGPQTSRPSRLLIQEARAGAASVPVTHGREGGLAEGGSSWQAPGRGARLSADSWQQSPRGGWGRRVFRGQTPPAFCFKTSGRGSFTAHRASALSSQRPVS